MAPRRNAAAPLAAYVLHRHDWSESSLILELFTRELGRIAVVAKGAKRPYSQLRPVLLPFQRLAILLGSKRLEQGAEIQLLRSAEWGGAGAMLSGEALLSGFHLNELLMRALARQDPHPALFDAYADTLPVLAQAHREEDDPALAAALRAFELRLLTEMGVLPELGLITATQQPVQATARHRIDPEAGVVALAALLATETSPARGPTSTAPAAPGSSPGLSGRHLHALQSALDAGDRPALQQACRHGASELKAQLRLLLHYHLNTSTLRTRALMVEVQHILDTRST